MNPHRRLAAAVLASSPRRSEISEGATHVGSFDDVLSDAGSTPAASTIKISNESALFRGPSHMLDAIRVVRGTLGHAHPLPEAHDRLWQDVAPLAALPVRKLLRRDDGPAVDYLRGAVAAFSAFRVFSRTLSIKR